MDPFQYLYSLEKFGIKFGLENIRALCAALGNPQNAFPSVLIAGTNGKGSVTAMVDAGLRAGGVRVGRYTSPHLIRLEERFAVNGVDVDTAALAGALDDVRRAIDALLASGSLDAPPTFFEMTTAAAFLLFRQAKVDLAVLEVGLGGRLDSTNCVEPVAAAITSIAFDHEQYLGHTLAAIAGEKAGIIRSAIPVVIGPLDEEARRVILAAAAAAGAEIIDASQGVRASETTVDGNDGRTLLRLSTAAADYGSIALGLRGAHQVPNALVAVALLEALSPRFPITRDAVIAGLRDVTWPGRLQVVEAAGGRRVLLDAAHNPAGARTLAAYLSREGAGPLPIVFGAMRDKNVAEMLRILVPAASTLVVTEPANSRAWPAEELAALARSIWPEGRVAVARSPMAALEHAWTEAPTICAAGSIFLIGDILNVIGVGGIGSGAKSA